MKWSISRTALPVMALAMAGLGFYHVDHESQKSPLAAPLETPARSPYEDGIAASGVVEARSENIAIGAALAGLVLEVFVPIDRVGTHVTAGQPLFRVDDRHLKAQLKVAEAQVAMAESNLSKLKLQPRPEELPPSLAKVKVAAANAAILQDKYQRARRLVDGGSGAISQEEFVIRQREFEAALQDQARAQAEYDLIKAGAWKPDIDVAKAALEAARAEVEQVETEIDRATVVSPVDGVVLKVNVRAGERIGDRDTKPLVVLGDVSTYHVRVDIDERDIARFRLGAQAKAYPRGETNHEIAMQFARVEPLVVPKSALTGDNTERVDTRVLQVLFAIETTNHPVYVGQQLDVFIDGKGGPADSGPLAKVK